MHLVFVRLVHLNLNLLYEALMHIFFEISTQLFQQCVLLL